ncbi:endonuclease/exonuclease/phosphatase family protein [Occallatibacter riparius]|uniref:Endonuclease/exonuclease/phosphatase family protein n=1 Tax=Occallatibacter riparius TaxID=1002689 RepID=A0A9J7BQR2_9BACT|nr:endonuclease/exonuclease/phosphatase family protein [Occallatibacter riparius]UWZ85155.1 endonuclease/exonuclease/phosphatase family protein [Occallatibacter riparius]
MICSSSRALGACFSHANLIPKEGTMRLATFNAENLFDRPKAMNLSDRSLGDQILSDFAELNQLIEKDPYTPRVKEKILSLFHKQSRYIKLNEDHGRLLSGDKKTVIASGRSSWIGFFELIEGSVKEPAIDNTGRVVKELKGDVTCIIEVEDRAALCEFNKEVLNDRHFDHVMVVPGNDLRGINVGVLVREPQKIIHMVSHVDDKDEVGQIFSRDCMEYTIQCGEGGPKLLVLVNHFKAKDQHPASSDEKRMRQAKRVREIYEQRKTEFDYIAIMGDLNDSPDSDPLKPLLRDGSDLVDVWGRPGFNDGGYPGTYLNCTPKEKIDYILVSPQLAKKFKTGGVERRGIWAGNDGKKFHPFMNKAIEAASDHAGLWATFDFQPA